MFAEMMKRARAISEHEAPHLYQKIRELAEKAGHKEEITIHYSDFPIANAGAYSKRDILITNGALEALSYKVGDPVTAEVEALLAHELSHNMEYEKQSFLRVGVPILFPLVAMLGVHIYDKTQEKKKKQQQAKLHELLDSATEEVHGEFKPISTSSIPQAVQQSVWDQIVTTAKYAAAGALGLTAGLLFARQMSNHYEYKADAFSDKLTGKGKDLISALDKIENHTLDFIEKNRDKLKPTNLVQRIIHECINAHPSNAKRGTALGL